MMVWVLIVFLHTDADRTTTKYSAAQFENYALCSVAADQVRKQANLNKQLWIDAVCIPERSHDRNR